MEPPSDTDKPKRVVNHQPWSQLLILVIVGAFNPIWLSYQSSKQTERQALLNRDQAEYQAKLNNNQAKLQSELAHQAWVAQMDYEQWKKGYDARCMSITKLYNSAERTKLAWDRYEKVMVACLYIEQLSEAAKIIPSEEKQTYDTAANYYHELEESGAELAKAVNDIIGTCNLDSKLLTLYKKSVANKTSLMAFTPDEIAEIQKLSKTHHTTADVTTELVKLTLKHRSDFLGKEFVEAIQVILNAAMESNDKYAASRKDYLNM